ncbi:MAG: DUF120 domain-containing protein [Conexivisphaerales archaeon]
MNKIQIKHFELLFNLMLLGAKDNYVKIKTADLAAKLGKSQQAASIYLITLEREGLIEKQSSRDGTVVKITQSGLDQLVTVYLLLRNELEESPTSIVLEGSVFSGMGEGAYYMSLPKYKEQFLKKLGFEPFPGTLNLKIDLRHIMEREKLEQYKHLGIKIEGFSDGARTYGALWCFHCLIESIRGAVVLIERTHYDISVVEVISPVNFRKELSLNDGDRVKITIFI